VEPKERRAFEDFGRCVREARLGRGWTQEAAAERAGIDVRDLQRIEAGRVNVTLRTVFRLAKVLGTSAADLLSPPTSREPRKPGRPAKQA
jgi:transcriptional regulator with XRE-family HTH domain